MSYTEIPDVSVVTEQDSLLKDVTTELEAANNAPKQITTDKLITSIGYMLCMGVCGIVLVALGSTLSGLAANIDGGISATNLVRKIVLSWIFMLNYYKNYYYYLC